MASPGPPPGTVREATIPYIVLSPDASEARYRVRDAIASRDAARDRLSVARGGLTRAAPAGAAPAGRERATPTETERHTPVEHKVTQEANHARDGDVTEGYAADWTVEQLREPAQRVADRIDLLMRPKSFRQMRVQVPKHGNRSTV